MGTALMTTLTPALTLSQRLAVVRENANLSPISDSTTPATLATFLAIYHKARCACYIDYMEGAQVLHDWLTSKGEVPLYTKHEQRPMKVPSLCVSYDMLQLGKIVGITGKAADTTKAVCRIYTALHFTRY